MKTLFEPGFTDPVGEDGNWESGINHFTEDGQRPGRPATWLQRIVCYGETREQAERLRDFILEKLQQ